MKENQISIEPELGSIPTKGTTYWYLRSNMVVHKFIIIETEWIGGVSDLLRLAKGNVFLSQNDVNEAEYQLNQRLEMLKAITQTEEYKKKLAEEEARRNAELEERKRQREKKNTLPDAPQKGKYSQINRERAIKYEARRKKKSPHPDIVV